MQTSPSVFTAPKPNTTLVDELMTLPEKEPTPNTTPPTQSNPTEPLTRLLKKLEEMPAIDHTSPQAAEEKSLPAPEELPELPQESLPEEKNSPIETREAPSTPDALFPSWWEKYKDLKAAWVLGAHESTLPVVMQDVMDGVKEFLQEVRSRTGRDPKQDETIEEYYHGEETPPSQETNPAPTLKTNTPEIPPTEESTEEILSQWDNMLLGGGLGNIPRTPPTSTAPSPEVVVKKTSSPIPKRPEEKKITQMQEQGAQKPVQVFEAPTSVEKTPVKEIPPAPSTTTSSKNIPKKPSLDEGQPVSSHYTGLLSTLMRNQGIDERHWEAMKDRPAAEAIRDDNNGPLSQYIKELETKNGPSTLAPKDGELLWQYIERLLPH